MMLVLVGWSIRYQNMLLDEVLDSILELFLVSFRKLRMCGMS